MSKEIKHTEIVFDAEWFQSGYFVYVLTIKHQTEGMFYYIGQTGDRNHEAARSPFYRLMGHYSPYRGTDAQLVNGIFENKLVIEVEGKSKRVCLEEAFCNKTIEVKANYFNVLKFDNSDHIDKRKLVENVEQLVIANFAKENKKLFNRIEGKKSKSIPPIAAAQEVANTIIDFFNTNGTQ